MVFYSTVFYELLYLTKYCIQWTNVYYEPNFRKFSNIYNKVAEDIGLRFLLHKDIIMSIYNIIYIFVTFYCIYNYFYYICIIIHQQQTIKCNDYEKIYTFCCFSIGLHL